MGKFMGELHSSFDKIHDSVSELKESVLHKNDHPETLSPPTLETDPAAPVPTDAENIQETIQHGVEAVSHTLSDFVKGDETDDEENSSVPTFPADPHAPNATTVTQPELKLRKNTSEPTKPQNLSASKRHHPEPEISGPFLMPVQKAFLGLSGATVVASFFAGLPLLYWILGWSVLDPTVWYYLFMLFNLAAAGVATFIFYEQCSHQAGWASKQAGDQVATLLGNENIHLALVSAVFLVTPVRLFVLPAAMVRVKDLLLFRDGRNIMKKNTTPYTQMVVIVHAASEWLCLLAILPMIFTDGILPFLLCLGAYAELLLHRINYHDNFCHGSYAILDWLEHLAHHPKCPPAVRNTLATLKQKLE